MRPKTVLIGRYWRRLGSEFQAGRFAVRVEGGERQRQRMRLSGDGLLVTMVALSVDDDGGWWRWLHVDA